MLTRISKIFLAMFFFGVLAWGKTVVLTAGQNPITLSRLYTGSGSNFRYFTFRHRRTGKVLCGVGEFSKRVSLRQDKIFRRLRPGTIVNIPNRLVTTIPVFMANLTLNQFCAGKAYCVSELTRINSLRVGRNHPLPGAIRIPLSLASVVASGRLAAAQSSVGFYAKPQSRSFLSSVLPGKFELMDIFVFIPWYFLLGYVILLVFLAFLTWKAIKPYYFLFCPTSLYFLCSGRASRSLKGVLEDLQRFCIREGIKLPGTFKLHAKSFTLQYHQAEGRLSDVSAWLERLAVRYRELDVELVFFPVHCKRPGFKANLVFKGLSRWKRRQLSVTEWMRVEQLMRQYAQKFVAAFRAPLMADFNFVRYEILADPETGSLEILVAPGAGKTHPNLQQHNHNTRQNACYAAEKADDRRFILLVDSFAERETAFGKAVVLPFLLDEQTKIKETDVSGSIGYA